MESPLVSVVLPVRNREDVVAEALLSVLQQTYSALEVIVVDDASTDGSMAEVARVADERVRIVQNAGERSAGSARNAGIALATGRYLAFQDSDDWWHPEKLAVQMHAIMRAGSERVVAVGSKWRLMTSQTTSPTVSVSVVSRSYSRDDVLSGRLTGVIGTPMLLVDRERVAVEPLFDPRFPSLEEREFVYRLLPAGEGTLAIMDSVLVDVRRGRNDHVANPSGSLIGYEQFLAKYPGELAALPGATDWYHYRAMREALILRDQQRVSQHRRLVSHRDAKFELEYALGRLLGYTGLALATRARLRPRLAMQFDESA